MKKTLALAGLMGLVAACGGPAASGRAPDPAKLTLVDRTATAAGPLDSATWLLDEEPGTLDLDVDGGTPNRTVLANVCERLLQTQPDMTVKPWLAEKVERPDPRTMVLHLRADATFHDGSPVTADDVVWSLKRHAGDGMDESDEFEDVESVAKSGERRVTIAFKKPNALFEQAIAGGAGIVFDREVVEKHGKEFGSPESPDACSGPYRLKEWKSGSHLTIERHDAYWNKDVKPLTKTVTFTWADETAMVNSLATGAADGAYLSDTGPAVALQGNQAVTVAFGPTTRVFVLLPTDRGALKDPRIRRALSLAVDRAGIVRSGFAGLARPWKVPVGAGAWSYEKQAFQAAYDGLAGAPDTPQVEEARKLVQEAGAPATPIVVATNGEQTRNVIANAVVDAAKKIGLTAQIKTVPAAEYGSFYTDKALRAQVDLVPDDWYITKADPIGFYDNGLTGSSNNWVGYSSPAYDKLVASALAATDPARRAKDVIELQRLFTADMVWISLAEVPNAVVLGGKVTGPPASQVHLGYPWAADLGRKG
ncbi:MAG: putative transporter solute-binding protein [Nonomuraea muscovyensis]|uniref:Peptide/nickel transport system substrate-binding protein n=1 Tax=Nonomuraea muscovyensis TaxID=1124761 RepID=A0A7X0C7Q4_9ACTN|nr:ABC transporter substrate-binding protein [Nonomuraea muscovyensis]MBB6350080.1 peptide/nickel transport system substrate-binding protein [Nonomuraea muscovyensis]MDF2707997.1 putative transporter solute-binding protein [Nonomuraea muscovyensis]